MARSEVDLANAALAYLVRDSLRDLSGSDLATTQTLGGMERAMHEVIEAYDWPDCRVVGKLTKSVLADKAGWTYSYVMPADAVKVWFVGEQKKIKSVPYAFGMSSDLDDETQYIFTDMDEAYVRYGSSRAGIGRFSAQIFDLMALKLAVICAMPLGKDAKLHQYLSREFDKKLSAVKTLQANSEPEVIDIDFVPETVLVRSQ